MKFLIQTINGYVPFDFAHALIKGVHVNQQLRNEPFELEYHEHIPSDTRYHDFIPIGSLEYVYTFLWVHHQILPKHILPINIPSQLSSESFLKRKLTYLTKDIPKGLFIKSATRYKGITRIYEGESLPPDTYLVSEVVDFIAEFRVIVMQERILDVRQYAGELFTLPSEQVVKDMIRTYTQAPPSYTLDVGLTEQGDTVVIEAHPFVSCGVYGFNQEHYVPYLAAQGFHWLKRQALLVEKNKKHA